MAQVFLSYARANTPFAQQLAAALSDAGVDIQDALDRADLMIVIISPESMASRNVENEWQYYMDEGKPIVPVLLQSTRIPFQLRRIQHIDFEGQNFDAGLRDLLKNLSAKTESLSPEVKAGLDLLKHNYQTWITLDRDDVHLLSLKLVQLADQYLRDQPLSLDLVEYLLCSALIHWNDPPRLEAFQAAMLTPFSETDRLELFSRLLANHNLRIRERSLQLARQLHLDSSETILINHLSIETEVDVKRRILQTMFAWGQPVPENLADHLLNDPDWLVRSYAMAQIAGNPRALIMADGTDFARSISLMASDAGYRVIGLDTGQHPILDWELFSMEDGLLRIFDLIILIRGEHYGDSGVQQFYRKLKTYVAEGGTLFATAWVGWETQHDPELAAMLPFVFHRFREDVEVACRPTDHALASQFFPAPTSYLTSLEYVQARPEATVLLESTGGNPIFSFHDVGAGRCYYFNSCQHSCTITMPSPLENNAVLEDSLRRILSHLYSQAATH